jgi:hypothetical protein
MVQALGRLGSTNRALKTLLQPLLARTIRQELRAWRNLHPWRAAINDIYDIPERVMEYHGWKNLEHTYIRYLGASATWSTTSLRHSPAQKKEKHVQIHTDGPFYTFESPFNESANDDFDIPAGTIKLTLQTCELVHLTRVRDMFTYRLIENEQYDRLDQDSVAWEVEECLGDNSEG